MKPLLLSASILLSLFAGAASSQTTINGQCGTSPGVCASGTVYADNGLNACGTQRTWGCSGTNGGTVVGCSYDNGACPPPADPVNGACGTVVGTCAAGTLVDAVFGSHNHGDAHSARGVHSSHGWGDRDRGGKADREHGADPRGCGRPVEWACLGINGGTSTGCEAKSSRCGYRGSKEPKGRGDRD